MEGSLVVVAKVMAHDRQKPPMRKIQIVGGKCFGMKQMTTELWDLAGGYIIALHGGVALSFTSAKDGEAPRAMVYLSQQIEQPQSVFAALDVDETAIMVVIMTAHNLWLVEMPLVSLKPRKRSK